MAPWSCRVRLQLGDAGWRGTSRVGNGWEQLRMKQGKTQGGWVRRWQWEARGGILWVAPEQSAGPPRTSAIGDVKGPGKAFKMRRKEGVREKEQAGDAE